MPKSSLVLMVGGLLSAASPSAAQTRVYLSELHYDNSGTDVGEGVEVCGPAGTNLDGWTIQLYNGNGGSQYSTLYLAGKVEDQCNGYGCVAISDLPSNSIQNGSPDGIAIVDDNGSVIQFLSYEGTFTAVDGDAMGMTSINIGVQEGPATSAGLSLQLMGDGISYEDFTWTTGVTQSFGDVNEAMTFNGACQGSDPVPPQAPVFLSELHYDNSGLDVGEGVEVCGPAALDLNGWSIQLYNGNGGSQYGTLYLAEVVENLCNGYGCVAISDLPSNSIQNGSPDGIAIVDDSGSVVQFLSYEGTFTAIDGDAVGLTSTNIGIQEGSSTSAGTSLQLTGDGTSYEDFTWRAGVTQSFGDINVDMNFNGGCS